jgi:hypothetical protein
MPSFEVNVAGAIYDVEAPDENTAWTWAVATHTRENQPQSLANAEDPNALKTPLSNAPDVVVQPEPSRDVLPAQQGQAPLAFTFEPGLPDTAPPAQAAAAEQPVEPSSPLDMAAPAIRGAGPVAIGATAGAALGSIVPGVGTALGAGAGAAAVGLSSLIGDPAIGFLNKALGTNLGTPTQAWTALFDKLGIAESKTAAAKLVEAASRGGADALSGVGMGNVLKTSANAVTQRVGQLLASQAQQQTVAGMAAGVAGEAAGQVAEMAGASPLASAAARFTAGIVGGIAGAKAGSFTGLARRPRNPAIQQALDAGIEVATSDVIKPRGMIGKFFQNLGESTLLGTGAKRTRQQGQREEAITSLLADHNVSLDAPSLAAVGTRLSAVRGQRLRDLVSTKTNIISNASRNGIHVPLTNTQKVIASEIARLKGISSGSFKDVEKRLQAFSADITGKTLDSIEANRKLLGDAFSHPDLITVRGEAQKSRDAIYKALRQEMGDFIQVIDSKAARQRWELIDKRLAEMSEELGMSALRSALKTGTMTPEKVSAMLFSKTPSELRMLHRGLDTQGRALARTAILERVTQMSLDSTGLSISPQRFQSNLRRLSGPVGVFFRGRDLAQVRGLERALELTERAGNFALNPPTGVRQQVPIMNASLYTVFSKIGGWPAGVMSLLGAGPITRIYESAAVRDILLALPRVTRGGPEEARLIKRLTEATHAMIGKELIKNTENPDKQITFLKDSTTRENTGTGFVSTDKDTGYRMVSQTGKTIQLYSPNGVMLGIFSNEESAQRAADKMLIKSAMNKK